MPDLFSSAESSSGSNPSEKNSEPEVLSVSQLTQGLNALVEKHYDDLRVEGELSNFTRAASGHCYFTLKDDDSQIRCVMWRYLTKHVYFDPEDGMRVRITGHASVYERRGELQIQAQSMQRAGKGAQQEAFERLKKKLKAEGLFDRERKKPLPSFPKRVGVVTSGTGAAFQDVRSVLERRFPSVQVILCPVPVQGLEAPQAVADAIRRFNAVPADHDQRVDVLIVGRGGGSAEDLWAFNEEGVARAIADSTLPVISAVGHETDVSIADFVADERAATPSMAAEIAVPDRREVEARVRTLADRMNEAVARRVRNHRRRVEQLMGSRTLYDPVRRLQQMQQTVDGLVDRLQRGADRLTERRRHRLDRLTDRLRSADPHAPLRRGYVRVEHDDEVVVSAADLAPGDRVRLHFDDGTRDADVAE